MMRPYASKSATEPSFVSRIKHWLKKPIEQKIIGIGGRKTALGYALWVRLHHYDFGGVLHPHELLSEPSRSLAHSTHYLVSDVYSLKLLLDEAFSLGSRFDVFLDIGCGKGMPPLYARRYYAFRESIGMDFSEKLIETAQLNQKKSGDPHVRFIEADASDFRISNHPTLVYLHNPFGPELLRDFIKNNLDHFKAHPSVIAYAFDVHRHVFHELGFEVLYRSPKFSHSLWRPKTQESD